MVMTHPPTYHFWEFLMKNMIPTNCGLILTFGVLATKLSSGSSYCYLFRDWVAKCGTGTGTGIFRVKAGWGSKLERDWDMIFE